MWLTFGLLGANHVWKSYQRLKFYQTKYSSKEVSVSLVSIDFVSRLGHVNQFISKNKLTSMVILLNEPDYDSWYSKIEPTWSGVLTATLIINTETREKKYFEKSIKLEELQKEINSFLNK
jgi:hypothetical protein